ncbi:predicted protein [Arabidopsis lyrata subsp. lyrata]|uniref:Predicted protein n=1 Tax=Arabidopsis lyrata subsp. lyrata TaxID=81972 RepID=D7KLW6_ARALL|nr:predicted protein [Arabidopsis lyrata subsp. lyrata]
MDSNELDTNVIIAHEEATGVGPQEEGDPDNIMDLTMNPTMKTQGSETLLKSRRL